MNTLSGRKAGFKIKGAYGARKNPFCLVEDEKPIKVFYSENDYEDDAITQLIIWMKSLKVGTKNNSMTK